MEEGRLGGRGSGQAGGGAVADVEIGEDPLNVVKLYTKLLFLNGGYGATGGLTYHAASGIEIAPAFTRRSAAWRSIRAVTRADQSSAVSIKATR